MNFIQEIFNNAAELWAFILALGIIFMVFLITILARGYKRRHMNDPKPEPTRRAAPERREMKQKG